VIRRGLALAVVLATAALGAQQARADGDPASDVLIVQNVFLPFQAELPKPLQSGLLRATAEAKPAGYPIKVALITQPADLGAIPSLFEKPQTYAQFLWQELSFVYHGRLLVVMPNGFGFFNGRVSIAAEQRVLSRLPVGAGLDGMAASALNAVLDLAAAAGHPLDVPRVPVAAKPVHSSSNNDRFVIGGAVLGGALLAAAVVLIRRRRRST
jgi:hypothetical protein